MNVQMVLKFPDRVIPGTYVGVRTKEYNIAFMSLFSDLGLKRFRHFSFLSDCSSSSNRAWKFSLRPATVVGSPIGLCIEVFIGLLRAGVYFYCASDLRMYDNLIRKLKQLKKFLS